MTDHPNRSAGSASATCSHENTTARLEYIKCNDCGAVRADAGWGIAAFKWFKSLDEAGFYRDNGRLPAPLTGDVAQPEKVPVAWRWHFRGERAWTLVHSDPGNIDGAVVEPLYADPAQVLPRSSAGNARQLPAYVSNAAREAARDALADLETNTRFDSDTYTLAQHMIAFAHQINEPQTLSESAGIEELAAAVHEGRFSEGENQINYCSFDDECASGRAYCRRIAHSIRQTFDVHKKGAGK